jgi:prepilin-type N-terminal cleavage/methylation domain-containing protein
MHTNRQPRRGFSLIEVSIAMAVFAVLMVALLQSMVGIGGYAAQEGGMTDVATMGRLAVSQITNDIANTAWFYQYDPVNHNFINPLTPLYPIVTKGAVVTAANGTTSELDSIEFIKIRTSTTVAASPSLEHYSTLNFFNNQSQQVPPPVVTLDQYNNGTTSAQTTSTPLLIVNPNYPQAAGAFDILVSHVWESAYTGYTFDQNMDPTQLRHTRLEVITNSYGIQQLVRSYYNGGPGVSIPTDVNGSWNPQDQTVLLDYVQSFVINTQQNTQGVGLSNNVQPNQLSITITVNRPEPTNPTVSTLSTFTVYASMRSITH